MATTMFFEGVLTDKVRKDQNIEIEFGRSSYYSGESLVYLTVDGKTLILDEATGRKMLDAMDSLRGYLGYGKA
jgi:hypothetical protein